MYHASLASSLLTRPALTVLHIPVTYLIKVLVFECVNVPFCMLFADLSLHITNMDVVKTFDNSVPTSVPRVCNMQTLEDFIVQTAASFYFQLSSQYTTSYW